MRRLEDIFNIFHVWRRYSASAMIHWWLNLPVTMAASFCLTPTNFIEYWFVFVALKRESLDEYSQVIKSEHDGVLFRWRKWFFPFLRLHPLTMGILFRIYIHSVDIAFEPFWYLWMFQRRQWKSIWKTWLFEICKFGLEDLLNVAEFT